MPVKSFLASWRGKGAVAPVPPVVTELAAALAERWGCDRVIDVATRTPGHGGAAVDWQRLAAVCWLGGADRRAIRVLRTAADAATVTVVASPHVDASSRGAAAAAAGQLDDVTRSIGRAPAFSGWLPSTPATAAGTAVAIFEGQHVPPLEQPPSSFRVLAIMTAYNERDIIGATVRRLLDQRVEVHVVDNWSSDGTYELLRDGMPGQPVSVERFPSDATGVYEWERLLIHVEETAAASGADWIIHHDADEIRESPWAGMSLRDALWNVQRRGFNAIDHTVLDFRPVDDGFHEGDDPATFFTHCEFGRRPGHFVQVKGWRNLGRVALAPSGGHSTEFDGRRVFPYKFLLRHYPIRSPEHARKKIFADRRPRWSQEERRRGWHVQYDRAEPSDSFVYDPALLLRFDADFRQRHLAEILTGVGIPRE